MAGKVPLSGVTTIMTTLHRHPLPVCTEKNHSKTCRRFRREAGCVAIRLDKKTVIADCFHSYLR